MYRSLSSLVPNADDLLALEVEELADILLTHLNSAASPVFQNGLISQNNFFNSMDHGTQLMRDAFKPSEKNGKATPPGPLTDIELPVGEQVAMANLFAGAIGVYKNP